MDNCLVGTLNLDGIGSLDLEGLFHMPKHCYSLLYYAFFNVF